MKNLPLISITQSKCNDKNCHLYIDKTQYQWQSKEESELKQKELEKHGVIFTATQKVNVSF